MESKARLQIVIGGALIALAVLIVAGGVLFTRLSQPQQPAERELQEGEVQTHRVWAAARALPRGTVLSDNDVRVMVLAEQPAPDVLTPAVSAHGRIALEDVEAGQILLTSIVGEHPYQAGLAALVPEGHRAVAIKVSDEVAVANLVRPGDKVDVQLVIDQEKLVGRSGRGEATGGDKSEAHILLQNVLVLAVGDLVQGEAETEGGAAGAAADPPPYRTVSLAVMPEQASTLALARNMGLYYLSLRHMDDTEETKDKTVTLKALRGADVNKRPPPVRRTGSSPQTVQIINGPVSADHKLGGGS